MYYEGLARWLDDLIARTGLNYNAFAARSGVNQSTLTNLSKGFSLPEITTLLQVIAAANRLGLQTATIDDALEALAKDDERVASALTDIRDWLRDWGAKHDQIPRRVRPEGLKEYRTIMRRAVQPHWEQLVASGGAPIDTARFAALAYGSGDPPAVPTVEEISLLQKVAPHKVGHYAVSFAELVELVYEVGAPPPGNQAQN